MRIFGRISTGRWTMQLIKQLYLHFVQVVIVVLVQLVPFLVKRPETVYRVHVGTSVASERKNDNQKPSWFRFTTFKTTYDIKKILFVCYKNWTKFCTNLKILSCFLKETSTFDRFDWIIWTCNLIWKQANKVREIHYCIKVIT